MNAGGSETACITDTYYHCAADYHDVQTARFVLQRAADYHGRLQELSQNMGQGEVEEYTHLEAEWTAMRIALVSLPPFDKPRWHIN